ncbi:hypothetical protein M2277_005091 [Paenibacillus sp. LBL]|nr:hypothetical protein [Paenibacillus sp. LBL]
MKRLIQWLKVKKIEHDMISATWDEHFYNN